MKFVVDEGSCITEKYENPWHERVEIEIENINLPIFLKNKKLDELKYISVQLEKFIKLLEIGNK